MADFIFTLKMLGFTLVLILFMQIKVGPATLEERAYLFLQTSPITHQLQKVAEGGARLITQAYQKVKGVIDERTTPERDRAKPAAKSLNLELKRQKYQEQLEQRRSQIQEFEEGSEYEGEQ